jgi:serine/threonine protein kinase
MDFLCSEPLVDADLWRPVRPLGRGGFGHVGLWHHKDQTGAVRDEVVIKEWPRDEMLEVQGRRGLVKEAVYQYQLNQRNCQNVPTLRQFKYVHDPRNPPNDRYRTYSEFCPYGDLGRIAMRYRAWGRYLPETFLWHVFHSMANVAREMSRPPWVNYTNMKNFPDNWSMIHFDLKPENILIGRKRRPDEAGYASPPPQSVLRPNLVDGHADLEPNDDFPPIKVTDFGLADITGAEDPQNPYNFFRTGTPAFMPPVRLSPQGKMLNHLQDMLKFFVRFRNNDTTESSPQGT